MLGEEREARGDAAEADGADVMECLRDSVGGGKAEVDQIVSKGFPSAEGRVRKGGADGTTDEGDGEHMSNSPVPAPPPL